jgi:tRNA G46 methylase TrmB
MDWTTYYPAFKASEPKTTTPSEVATKSIKMRKGVEVADIGCGFGGLLVALAPKLPDTLLLGKPHICKDNTGF